jgi:hypothetical protein
MTEYELDAAPRSAVRLDGRQGLIRPPGMGSNFTHNLFALGALIGHFEWRGVFFNTGVLIHLCYFQ